MGGLKLKLLQSSLFFFSSITMDTKGQLKCRLLTSQACPNRPGAELQESAAAPQRTRKKAVRKGRKRKTQVAVKMSQEFRWED